MIKTLYTFTLAYLRRRLVAFALARALYPVHYTILCSTPALAKYNYECGRAGGALGAGVSRYRFGRDSGRV